MEVWEADFGVALVLSPEVVSVVFAVFSAFDFPASDFSTCGLFEPFTAFFCVFASLILLSLRSTNYFFVL